MRPVLTGLRWVGGAVLCAAVMTSCTEGPGEPVGAASDSEAATPADSGGPSVPAVQSLVAPMRVAQVRWASGNVPRTVPGVDDALPSLLDDPPGRALVASYVPRDATGFAGEAIEFYGVDGRWRRLALGDLDLPRALWSGNDTYGAGALSPNGRWWAGPMRGGMFLVDLRTGRHDVLQCGDKDGMAGFRWSPDSDELVLIVSGRSTRVSAPRLGPQPFPRPDAYPTLLANGHWRECPAVRRVVSTCTTYRSDGAVAGTVDIPEETQSRWASPIDQVGGSMFYSVPKGLYGNHRHDWQILRADGGLHTTAELILPAGSQINGVQGAFDRDTLQLAALDQRLLLAWLVEDAELVRIIRPGVIGDGTGMDFWDVSFARDLVRVG